jgi:hypothetical protein
MLTLIRLIVQKRIGRMIERTLFRAVRAAQMDVNGKLTDGLGDRPNRVGDRRELHGNARGNPNVRGRRGRSEQFEHRHVRGRKAACLLLEAE